MFVGTKYINVLAMCWEAMQEKVQLGLQAVQWRSVLVGVTEECVRKKWNSIGYKGNYIPYRQRNW